MARDVVSEKPGHGGDGAGRGEDAARHAPERRDIEEADVGAMAGHHERDLEARHQPPGGKPPVGVDDVGAEALRRPAELAPEPEEVRRQGQDGERVEQQAPGALAPVPDALEPGGAVAEPPNG